MANQESKNIVENVVSAQKNVVDTVVENTRKYTNGNNLVNDTIQKGSEWYKNWLDNQKNVFTQTTEKTDNITGNVQENASKMNEFYQNWFNTQMGWAKQMWEMNMNHMKDVTNKATNTSTNPMDQFTNTWNNWNNGMSNMNSWMNGMNQANNWMNQMNNMNPFNMDSWKKTTDNATGMFNQYYELLNNSFSKLQENMQNGTTQDAYSNLINANEGFTRFYEMWTPMWKSIQDKTFNMEVYKQWANPAMYKDLMDKFFGFMPENTREHMQNMGTQMQEGMKQMSQMGMNNYQQMRGMMSNTMPGMNDNEMFTNMLNGYNTFYNNMNNAYAPFAKMAAPNKYSKSMAEWQDIANRVMVYNIKNAELQYMMYSQGTKVMDKLAENVAAKIQNGEEVNSMMALYQEWMNISDKTFVNLFETDEYSVLMAEVSAMQMRLRKEMEGQMEKMMTGIPVATRSEMDEMYKTIYDLKKQVRQLEKMLELDGEVAGKSEEKTNEEKTNKNRTAKK